MALSPGTRLTVIAYVHELAGRRAESQEALKELEEKHAVDSPYQIAAIHAVRGDKDAKWLERALAERDAGFANVMTEPLFENLHDDARWKPLLTKAGMVR